MSNQPVAVSAPNLVILRKSPQWSELRLGGFEAPAVIFAARVNQAFASPSDTVKPYDMLAQVTYDTVTTGAYTDILPGMSLWVGTAAGLHDVGIARVRKAATSTIIYFGEESDIEWADDLYLTVVREFLLWPRHVRIVSGAPKMDYDLAYSDQHSVFDPVPVWGSDRAVDVESYPAVVAFDAADSWVFGSTISAYSFSSGGIGTWTNPTTATPSLSLASYPSGGKVLVIFVVTAANGKTTTAYRTIHVYDATHRSYEDFELGDCSGTLDDGGFSFDVTMHASTADIRDRAPVILFSRDHYGKLTSDIVSLGQLPGCENIKAMGWIDGASIEYDSEKSIVQFTVRGAQYWLDRMIGFPPGVEIKKGNMAAAWTNIPDLTVDRALWHLLHWRCNATTLIDFYPSNDTKLASAFEVPTESIWQQIIEIAETSIYARPFCDEYNRLWVKVDANLVPEADRSAFPVIMTITDEDWEEIIPLTEQETTPVSLVDLSGVAVNSSGKGVPFFSLSPGHIFSHYGDIEIADRRLLSSQSQANVLCGLVYGKSNSKYPNIEIRLSQNNNMLCISPQSYVSIVIAAGDTLRGITYSGNLLIRGITKEWNNETGAFTTVLTCEVETFEQIAITGDRPEDTSVPPDDGGIDDPPPPPSIIIIDVPLEGSRYMLISTSNFGFLWSDTLQDALPTWNFMNAGIPTTNNPQKNSLRMKRCPSGLILAGMGDDTDTAAMKFLYYAAGLGGLWGLLADYTTVDQGTYGVPRICAFGVNEGASEEILMIAGGFSGLAVGTKKIYTGTRAGLSLVTGDLDIQNDCGDVSFDLGKWFVTSNRASGLSPRGWARLSQAGAIDVGWTDFTTTDLYLNNSIHHRGGGNVFTVEKNTHDILRIVSNNDGTVELRITPGFSFGHPYYGICASPDGTRLIGGNGAQIGQRSSDGGNTWGNIGTGGTGGMTVGYSRWANGGDNNWWFGATTQKILQTSDFGDTWVDKTGNLATLAPLCVITGMLVIP